MFLALTPARRFETFCWLMEAPIVRLLGMHARVGLKRCWELDKRRAVDFSSIRYSYVRYCFFTREW